MSIRVIITAVRRKELTFSDTDECCFVLRSLIRPLHAAWSRKTKVVLSLRIKEMNLEVESNFEPELLRMTLTEYVSVAI